MRLRDDASWDREGLPKHDSDNARRVNAWVGVWMVSYMVAVIVLGPFPGGLAATPLWAWVLVLAPAIPGILALQAYIRLLREGDELIRKVHVEAIVVGFCVGSVMAVAFSLVAQLTGQWEDAGAFTFLGMWLSYAIALQRARRRYR